MTVVRTARGLNADHEMLEVAAFGLTSPFSSALDRQLRRLW